MVALLGVVSRNKVFGLRQTERLKMSTTLDSDRFSGDADVVASIVEERGPSYHEKVRAVRKHWHAFSSLLAVDVGELVDVIPGERAENLGGGKVVAGEEVDAQVCGAQGNPVCVVGLRKPDTIATRVDAGLSVEADKTPGALFADSCCDHDQGRVER